MSRTAITARWPKLVTYPDDFSYVIYRLRPTARWHDGKPVTPEDVIFSFETFKKQQPDVARFYYQHIVKAEKVGDHDVKFFFDSPGNRELPLITGAAQRVAEALVGRHRRAGPQARRDRNHAGAAAGVGALSHQGVRRRPVAGARTGEGLLGPRICPTASARTISTNSATNSSATTSSGARPSRPTSSTGMPSAAPRNGRWPMTSPRCTTGG